MNIIYWPFPFNYAGHVGVLFAPYETSRDEFLNFHPENESPANDIFEPRGRLFCSSVIYSSFDGNLPPSPAVANDYRRDLGVYGDNLHSFEICHLENRFTTEKITQVLTMINRQYKASGYKLLWRNCGHYVQEVFKKLGIQIPITGLARLTGYYSNPKDMILAILSKKLNELNKIRENRLSLLRTNMHIMTNLQYANAISSLLNIESLRLLQEASKNNQTLAFRTTSNSYMSERLWNNMELIYSCICKIKTSLSKEVNKGHLKQLVINLNGEIKSRVNEILTGFPCRTTTQDLHWLRTMR